MEEASTSASPYRCCSTPADRATVAPARYPRVCRTRRPADRLPVQSALHYATALRAGAGRQASALAMTAHHSSKRKQTSVRDYRCRAAACSRKAAHHRMPRCKRVSFSVDRARRSPWSANAAAENRRWRALSRMIEPADRRRPLHRRRQGRQRQAGRRRGAAPQGADRLPEPLRLAQPAPEDRRRLEEPLMINTDLPAAERRDRA